jgi:putative N6-adenine-specific DNA methylase
MYTALRQAQGERQDTQVVFANILTELLEHPMVTPPADAYQLFAVSSPGLEPFTAQELHELGGKLRHPWPKHTVTPKEIGDEGGGVEFAGSLADVYRANLHLRTASRVLLRLGTFLAASFPELRRKASRLSWESFLLPGRPVALRVTCHKSRLYHQGAVAERLVGAISDRLGGLPPVQKFTETASASLPQLILVRLKENLCTVSVDSSGEILHRRGYRLVTAKAPLRETLAAGMLLASQWDISSPLIDPFCGSGTIAIEAALMAHQWPPGRFRRFAFMEWPIFDAKTWEKVLGATGPSERASLPRLIGSDRDAGAIEAARANARRAGVAESIEFSIRPISAMESSSGPGWIVTNPPYGIRTDSNRDLRNLYARFGRLLRDKCAGWQITMLCSSQMLLQSTGLKFDDGIILDNGGLRVKLVRGRIE